MKKKTSINDLIFDLEKKLALCKFILNQVPDAKVHNYGHGFSAKSVNLNYTNFEFIQGYNTIYVVPYLELIFEYNGSSQKVRINSSPRSSRLAYVTYDLGRKGYVLKFSKLAVNLKKNKFKEDMLNDCRIQILNFIKKYPNHTVDYSHLDPKLKKLLCFT